MKDGRAIGILGNAGRISQESVYETGDITEKFVKWWTLALPKQETTFEYNY